MRSSERECQTDGCGGRADIVCGFRSLAIRDLVPPCAVPPQGRTRDVLAMFRGLDRATEDVVATGMGPRRLGSTIEPCEGEFLVPHGVATSAPGGSRRTAIEGCRGGRARPGCSR